MNGRYYSLNEYLNNQFGCKVYKLSLDIGCTCPNRDGTLHNRGCIFCHNGSSHFAEAGIDINTQIENAKNHVKSKAKTEKFIAYFQSFTNTYGDINYLEKQFTTAIKRQDVVALSIGTRPDCLPPEILEAITNPNN